MPQKKISLELPRDIDMLDIKIKLEELIKIPKEKMHFSFQGERLLNVTTLEK